MTYTPATIHNDVDNDDLAEIILERKLLRALDVYSTLLSTVVKLSSRDERTFGVVVIDAQNWHVDHLDHVGTTMRSTQGSRVSDAVAV